jgi:uncharacterized coiled-coil DUF342 family protein
MNMPKLMRPLPPIESVTGIPRDTNLLPIDEQMRLSESGDSAKLRREIHELSKENDELRNTIKSLREQKAALLQDVDMLGSQRDAAEQQVVELRRELLKWKRKHIQAKDRAERFEAEVIEQGARIGELNSRVTQLQDACIAAEETA